MNPSQIEAFRHGLEGQASSAGIELRLDQFGQSSRLDFAIQDAIAAGRAAFPTILADSEPFLISLGRCAYEALGADPARGAPTDAELAAILSTLSAADLYLACAAGQGDAAAMEIVIDRLVRPSVAAACRTGDSSSFVDELTQVLRQKLLVAAEDGPPKILSFSGRAPLGAWIAVVVQRTVSTLRRSEGTREHFEKRAAIEADLVERDPELGYIKAHYADAFARSFEHALRELTDRERSLLRLHNLHGVTLQQLATVYGVDDSTISRWLKQARNLLVEHTGRHMREVAGISASEFPSLARALTSQVDVSLNLWLASVVTSGSR